MSTRAASQAILLRRFALLLLLPGAAALAAQPPDPFGDPYRELCAVCHGADMQGAAQGPPLAGAPLRHGDSPAQLIHSIAVGAPQAGMPAFAGQLDDLKIRRLAALIAEKRADLGYADFRIAEPPALPEATQRSERHAFRIEPVATGLDRLPFAIAPLPDGSLLVTEKTRGLRLVSADGSISTPVTDTPQAHDDGFQVPGVGLVYGQGYLLDVAPHPDYARNGWIYLHYTDRCSDCNEISRRIKRPVSMNALMRGRIRDGQWVDTQVLWRADIEQYTPMPDMAAGGRIAFDARGHVFFGIGIKGGSETAGVQDLGLPYGKIHRINDDGTIPADNPFVRTPGAMASVWTVGHRSPQGLEFDAVTGRLWSTEMGPRGGDEVNLLEAGRNYGWPLVSHGIHYDGSPVDGTALGIAFDPASLVPPAIDLTPSPAVAGFVVYRGAAFPGWNGDLIVGTLKATALYRMRVEDGRVILAETLVSGLGRIRDVAAGPDGLIYLLLEHASGSRVVKLVPAP